MAGRTSSGAPGGNAVTVTARLVLDGDHCRLIEEWTGQVSCTAFRRTACIARAHGVQTAPAAMELVRTHGRVKDDRILFAASRDGFSNHVFHENCDGFSPTLTFVLLHNGCLFGAYTAIPWSSISGPHPDPAAFLFSLSDGKPPEQGGRVPCRLFQFQNKGYSVWHAKDKGPLFGIGAGADLGLDLDKERLQRCRSNVGNTYAIPRLSVSEPLQSSSYLAGQLDNWDISEVVIYHCRELSSRTGSPVTTTASRATSRTGSRATSRGLYSRPATGDHSFSEYL